MKNEVHVFKERYERPKHATKFTPVQYIIDTDGCWISVGRNKEGLNKYTNVKRHGKQMRTHRYVYEQINGKIPEGLVVRHKCDKKACINPEHLELGTQYDNVQDTVSRGRTTKGRKFDSGLIDKEKYFFVLESFKNGKLLKEVSELLGVDEKVIRNICNNSHWSCSAFDPDRTYKINVKNNRARGASNGNSNVTKDIYEEILKLTKEGKTQKAIEKIVGISEQTIRKIQKGVHWSCKEYGI